jgi:hypothetical protein
MFTSQNWFLNILYTVRIPYSETRHLNWEYEILNIFQRERYGSNVIVFNITFPESGPFSVEYVFNIHMRLLKNWAYSLFLQPSAIGGQTCMSIFHNLHGQPDKMNLSREEVRTENKRLKKIEYFYFLH